MVSGSSLVTLLTSFLCVGSLVSCNDVIICPEDCDVLTDTSERWLCYTHCQRTLLVNQGELRDGATLPNDEVIGPQESESTLTTPEDFELQDQSSHYRFRRTPLYRLYENPSTGSEDEYRKRASSFVRIGRSLGKRASSFVRIGKSSPTTEDKRASSFVRIGKAVSDEELAMNDKRASSFVRIGKSGDGKRTSSFVRIGRLYYNLPTLEKKRASSFVRIGKDSGSSADYSNAKRATSFVRIGKADPLSDINSDKRASSFVRIGKSTGAAEEKRTSSFVRIGKSAEDLSEEKRASSFVRIGKSDPQEDEINKRAASFVRIGKSQNTNVQEEAKEKKASSFVRIG